MAGNTIGKSFTLTTAGESHGRAIVAIVDGCPARVPINIRTIQSALDRRRPGWNSPAVTARKESDTVEVLSGLKDGLSLGTPIAMLIRNTDAHSRDYDRLKNVFRPGHADYSYWRKYGIRDHRGGGRSSGRETAARVAGGSIAYMYLKYRLGDTFDIIAYTQEAAGIAGHKVEYGAIESNAMRAADMEASALMLKAVEDARAHGDSVGGIVECHIHGIPAGIGEPVFDKLDAAIAGAMLSIGAVKGIEFGEGFNAARLKGSQNNDPMDIGQDEKPHFVTNRAGGILGGISSGETIVFRLAIKPVPSINIEQETIALLDSGENNKYRECPLVIGGRHDTCLTPRIIPVVEAMAALVLADMVIRADE